MKKVFKKNELLREGYVKGLRDAMRVISRILGESADGCTVNVNGIEISCDAFADIDGDACGVAKALAKSGVFKGLKTEADIEYAIKDLVLYPSVEDYNEAADDDLTDADVDDGCDGFVRVPGYGIARIEH